MFRAAINDPTIVSVLFNEPKLLKCSRDALLLLSLCGFSALQRAEIAEISRDALLLLSLCGFSALQRAEIAEIQMRRSAARPAQFVSVLFNEPKLLKLSSWFVYVRREVVSVLFNEPKLLKLWCTHGQRYPVVGFSALQRAEIAEIQYATMTGYEASGFSALQRAEIAEILACARMYALIKRSFSALQRAEIAEIARESAALASLWSFSALQRAEIAEIG